MIRTVAVPNASVLRPTSVVRDEEQEDEPDGDDRRYGDPGERRQARQARSAVCPSSRRTDGLSLFRLSVPRSLLQGSILDDRSEIVTGRVTEIDSLRSWLD